MKSVTSDPYQPLSTLNSMVSLAVGSEPEKTGHIQAAIEFYRQRQSEVAGSPPPSALDIQEAVRRLVQFHIQNAESFGFRLWDLSRESYDPLWIRAHLLRELKRLAGYEQALLLIIGLRTAICPSGKYWTTQRAREYQKAITYIETHALQFKTTSTRLKILFAANSLRYPGGEKG